VEFAQHGQQFALTADFRVRLASLEARAAARTGDRALALDALGRLPVPETVPLVRTRWTSSAAC
jgi:hypothetical protein